MMRIMFVLAAPLLLAACQPEPEKTEWIEASSVTHSHENPGESAASGLTKERKAAIRKEYGIEQPKRTAAGETLVFDTGTQPASTVLFHVMKFANKSEPEVLQLLGMPDPFEDGTSISRMIFSYDSGEGEISLHFVDGIVSRIDIELSEAFQYPDEAVKAMRAVGLDVADGLEPESGSEQHLDFTGIEGFDAVRVVKDVEGNSGNIAEIRIIADEK